MRGAIIRDKELIMLPNEQATGWEGEDLSGNVAASCSQLIQLLQPKRPERQGTRKAWVIRCGKNMYQIVLVCVMLSRSLTHTGLEISQ